MCQNDDLDRQLNRNDLQFYAPGDGFDLPSEMKSELHLYFSGIAEVERVYFICVCCLSGERGIQFAVEFPGGSPLDVTQEQKELIGCIDRDTQQRVTPEKHFGVLVANNLCAWIGKTKVKDYLDLAEQIYERNR
jgi:hypothetical protein